MTGKERIARRVAMEFKDGDLVNLGFGVPLLCAKFVPAGRKIIFQAENGIIGTCPLPEGKEPDPYCFDAGGGLCDILPAGAATDSATSFGLIRGGHLDATVLGAMQVDAEGNLANWTVPGTKLAGMGGAMDLVAGAKRVIVATEHCDRNGAPKIMEKCTFPLTGAHVVDTIVTEFAYIRVSPNGLILEEIAPDMTVEKVISITGANLIVSPHMKEMRV